MSVGSPVNSSTTSPLPQEISAQVERILASPGFRGSASIQRLLRYLCKYAIDHPGQTVKEYELATEGLGRGGEFDSRVDAVVRLSVSRLRAKLAEYYLHDGAEDPILLDIPKGAYVLCGSYRSSYHTPRIEPLASGVEQARYSGGGVWSQRGILLGACGLIVVLVFVCAALGWQNVRFRAESIQKASSASYTERFWKGLFQSGRPVQVVTSDANLLFLSNFMNRTASLSEYRAQGYPISLIQEHVADPAERRVMEQFMATFFTTSQEGSGVAGIASAMDRCAIPFKVVYARDARLEPDTEENIVLLGNRMGNPWVELFDHKVNFVYEWDAQQRRGVLRNRNPKTGEKDAYVPKPGKSYATVVYASRPNGKGSVLMVGGTDMTAVEVGTRFLTDEASMAALYTALDIDPRQGVPHFELLLSARHLTDIPYNVEIVAYRVVRPG